MLQVTSTIQNVSVRIYYSFKSCFTNDMVCLQVFFEEFFVDN